MTLKARRKRGAIRGFSQGSRRRLFAFLFSLNQVLESLPLLVTLTYPGASQWNQIDREKNKRDLDSFLKRLRRSYPAVHGVWKLEPQRRGAPHFHLLVFGEDFLPIETLSRMWWEVVGSGDQANLRNGVDVRRVTSWRGAMSYVSKYVAKAVDELPAGWATPGRWWGYFNQRGFKRESEVIVISSTAALRAPNKTRA